MRRPDDGIWSVTLARRVAFVHTQLCKSAIKTSVALGRVLSIWILLPMLSLLMGALPFLRGYAEESAPNCTGTIKSR
jgi:hypothetical protein